MGVTLFCRYPNFLITLCRTGWRKLHDKNQLDLFSSFDTILAYDRHSQTDSGPQCRASKTLVHTKHCICKWKIEFSIMFTYKRICYTAALMVKIQHRKIGDHKKRRTMAVECCACGVPYYATCWFWFWSWWFSTRNFSLHLVVCMIISGAWQLCQQKITIGFAASPEGLIARCARSAPRVCPTWRRQATRCEGYALWRHVVVISISVTLSHTDTLCRLYIGIQ